MLQCYCAQIYVHQGFDQLPTIKTKPVRIHLADHGSLQLIAHLERRSPADVVHKALLEYLTNHKDDLAAIFTETQEAIADGDLEALSAIVARDVDARAEAAMAHIDTIG
jgi:hypothetical protein